VGFAGGDGHRPAGADIMAATAQLDHDPAIERSENRSIAKTATVDSPAIPAFPDPAADTLASG
jgi:hypothetical protein